MGEWQVGLEVELEADHFCLTVLKGHPHFFEHVSSCIDIFVPLYLPLLSQSKTSFGFLHLKLLQDLSIIYKRKFGLYLYCLTISPIGHLFSIFILFFLFFLRELLFLFRNKIFCNINKIDLRIRLWNNNRFKNISIYIKKNCVKRCKQKKSISIPQINVKKHYNTKKGITIQKKREHYNCVKTKTIA